MFEWPMLIGRVPPGIGRCKRRYIMPTVLTLRYLKI